MWSRLLWVGAIGGGLLALYAAAGVLQGGMLFTGERARVNVTVWGTVFIVALLLVAICSVTLWRRRFLQSSGPRE